MKTVFFTARVAADMGGGMDDLTAAQKAERQINDILSRHQAECGFAQIELQQDEPIFLVDEE